MVDLRDVVLDALRRLDSLDSYEIMSAFQQALTAFEIETDWVSMKTDPLFILTEEDAQIMAGDLIGRDLTGEEIRRVTKMLESGLDEWHEIMRIAIREAVK